MDTYIKNIEMLEQQASLSLSVEDYFCLIGRAKRYKSQLASLTLSDSQKVVCWERADIMEVLRTNENINQPLQILAAGSPYKNEIGQEQDITPDMAKLVGIYWSFISEIKDHWGTRAYKCLAKMVKGSETPPISADAVCLFCLDRIKKLGLPDEEIESILSEIDQIIDSSSDR